MIHPEPQKPLRLAFIGGAPNSAVGYAHFVASRMDGLWQLDTGLFSRKEDTNLKAAAVYGVEASSIYGSLESLLEGEVENLDAIALLTPTPLHHRMVMQCLEKGLPVICEKSLATNSLDAIKIQKFCKKNNGFLAVIYNYSGYPMVRELRSMIREGVLGEILHFQAEMPQEGFLRTDDKGNKPTPQVWRLQDGAVPTLHLDLAVHLHELVHYLTGLRPIEVISDQASRGWFSVVDNVNSLARYSQGVQGQFWFSKCALGHRNGLRLRIYGSKASAEWYQLNPEELLVSFVDGRRQIFDRASNAKVASLARYNRFKSGHPVGFNEALANLYMDIYDSLVKYKATGKQESDEVFGADLAVEGLLFLEAMVRSCYSQKWEAISLVP
jgi:predicted dehydrogenase